MKIIRNTLLSLLLVGGCFWTCSLIFDRAVEPAPINAPQADPTSTAEREWYFPAETDFRVVYESDPSNRTRQDWHDYWKWVVAFYKGNLLVDGWNAQLRKLLDVIRSEKTRNELRAMLNKLGRLIVAEWAKDNSVRRIDTGWLTAVGRKLKNAAGTDDGSGSVIRLVVDEIRQDVESRVSGG